MINSIIREDLKRITQADLPWEEFKEATVLISGANGMLASYLVFTLMYLNEIHPAWKIRVIGLCRNPEKAKKKFSEWLKNPLLEIKYQDVSDEVKVKGRVDYILHAASLASPQFYGVDPVGVVSANLFGTKNLLELAKEKKVKKFLFISSGAVSGLVKKKFITEKDYGFLDPTELGSCYAESKRMGENLCQCYFQQFSIPTLIARPEHAYGPTMDPESDKRVFAEFVSDIVNNRNIVIKSDGKAIRTFTYLTDTTDGFFRILLKGTVGQSYNISNPQGRISIGELAKLLVVLFPEKKLKIIYQKRTEGKDYLETLQKIRPSLSIEKIKRLGYYSQVNVAEGFKRTIKSFLKED